MPNINLISERRAEKRRVERLTRNAFFGMAGAAGALVAMFSWTTAEKIELAGQMAAADRRMDRLRPALDEISSIQRRTAESRPKVEILENARLSTLRWCSVFNAVPRSLPAGTWIEKWDATGGDATKMTLHAVTSSQSDAGQTAVLLSSQPIFQDVNITSTQAALAASGAKIVRFEITAGLRPATAPKETSAAPTSSAQVETKGNSDAQG
ncbi:MAG: PilN domain-containing protein [Armatimonadota bacterium]